MEVRVDVDDIKVEVRCNQCGNVIHILDQYEYHGALAIDIDPCDECGKEE